MISPASVCNITPTPSTTAAPIMPLKIVVFALVACSSLPLAAIYITPPQIMKITAIITEIIIKNCATLFTNASISIKVNACPVVGGVGVGKTAASTKIGTRTAAVVNEIDAIFCILFIPPPPFLALRSFLNLQSFGKGDSEAGSLLLIIPHPQMHVPIIGILTWQKKSSVTTDAIVWIITPTPKTMAAPIIPLFSRFCASSTLLVSAPAYI